MGFDMNGATAQCLQHLIVPGASWEGGARRARPRKATLQKYEADHAGLMEDLVPLRKDTMQMLSADWRCRRHRIQRATSDLPLSKPREISV